MLVRTSTHRAALHELAEVCAKRLEDRCKDLHDRIRDLEADRKVLRAENSRLLDLLAGKQQLEHDNLAAWQNQLIPTDDSEAPSPTPDAAGLADRIEEVWGDSWTPPGGWQLPGPHEPWPGDEPPTPDAEPETDPT